MSSIQQRAHRKVLIGVGLFEINGTSGTELDVPDLGDETDTEDHCSERDDRDGL